MNALIQFYLLSCFILVLNVCYKGFYMFVHFNLATGLDKGTRLNALEEINENEKNNMDFK